MVTISKKNLCELEGLIPREFIENYIMELNNHYGLNRTNYDLTDFQSSMIQTIQNSKEAENLLISGPTSCGKTLIGQILTAKELFEIKNSKAIFIVPLRALVTEKWNEFSKTMKDKRVIPCSSDYPLSDHIIASGEWDIAIVVVDIAYQWLANPQIMQWLLSTLKLILVDEFQIIEREIQGERLEIFLDFFRWYQKSGLTFQSKNLRIVLMSSDTVAMTYAKNWLNAKAPNSNNQRPVVLYESWKNLTGESEIFIRHNNDTCLVTDNFPETITSIVNSKSRTNRIQSLDKIIINICSICVKENFKVLIFVGSQKGAEQLALQIANGLLHRRDNYIADSRLINEIDSLDDSQIKQLLHETSYAGVGIHHGNMNQFERDLIEDHFRNYGENDLRIVVATPTLGMGINLSADVVILRDPYLYRLQKGKAFQIPLKNIRPQKYLISHLEYKNFVGRAGRIQLNKPNQFGLSILMINSFDFEKNSLFGRQLINGKSKPLKSSLLAPFYDFHPHIMVLLSALSNIDSKKAPIKLLDEIMECSYLFSRYKGTNIPSLCLTRIEENINDLEKYKLINNFRVSSVGQVMARHHISLIGINILTDIVNLLPKMWPNQILDLFFHLSAIPEVEDQNPWKKIIPIQKSMTIYIKEIRSYLKNYIPEKNYSKNGIFDKIVNGTPDLLKIINDESILRISLSLFCLEWVSGRPISQIRNKLPELFSKIYLKEAEDVGHNIATSFRALRNLLQIKLSPDVESYQEMITKLLRFEISLHYGIPIGASYLPIIISAVSNNILPRNVLLQTWAECGTWQQLQKWKNRPSPRTISQNAWKIIQDCISWWEGNSQEEIIKSIGTYSKLIEQDINEIFEEELIGKKKLFEELGLISNEDLTSTNMLWERFDNQGLQIILKASTKKVAKYNLENVEEVYRLLKSTIHRSPILGKLKKSKDYLFDNYNKNRKQLQQDFGILSEIQIDDELSQVLILAVKPNVNQFLHISKDIKHIIVVTTTMPDEYTIHHLSRKVRLWLSIEVVNYAAELIEYEPLLLSKFKFVFRTFTGVIANIDELLAIFKEDASTVPSLSKIVL